jgi:hypothetical protein
VNHLPYLLWLQSPAFNGIDAQAVGVGVIAFVVQDLSEVVEFFAVELRDVLGDSFEREVFLESGLVGAGGCRVADAISRDAAGAVGEERRGRRWRGKGENSYY